MGEQLPKVSVIVPVHNAEKCLPALMASLRAQDYPREKMEILLVDNRSSDNSAEVIAGFDDAIGLCFDQWGSSYAARNVGIEKATGEVLAFIDSDCIAKPHWLRCGVETLLKEGLDRVAGYVEFICSENPGICEIYDFTMNFQQHEFVNHGWSGAGNLFVRREVMEKVGPFEAEMVSNGDMEWGLRATEAGFSLGYAPDAVVRHATRKTLKALVLKWIRTEYGAAQAWRRCGLAELHLWKKKANWRPLFGVWKEFPEEARRTWRRRAAITLLANLLRLAGNLGNFLGYYNCCKWVLSG